MNRTSPMSIEHGNIRYMLPFETNDGLKVIAFWAMDDKRDYFQRYIEQIWLGLNKCLEHLDEKTIVVGDFYLTDEGRFRISCPLHIFLHHLPFLHAKPLSFPDNNMIQ